VGAIARGHMRPAGDTLGALRPWWVRSSRGAGLGRLPLIVGWGRHVMALAGLGDTAPLFSPSGACTPTSCAGPYATAYENYYFQYQVPSAQPAAQPGYVSELETQQPLLSNGDFRALFGYPWGQCSAWDAVCQSCMQQAAAASDRMWTSTRGVWPVGTAVNWSCDTSGVPSATGQPAQATTPAGSYIPSAVETAGQVVFSGGSPLVGPTVQVTGAVAAVPAPAAPAAAPVAGAPAAAPVASAPAAQSNAPGAALVGGGAAQSNAGGSSVAVPASVSDAVASLSSFLGGSYFSGIPNWALVAAGAGAFLLFAKGGRH
jgi:hypothetical protein